MISKEMDILNLNLRNLLFGPIQARVKELGDVYMQMPFSHRKILSVLFNAGNCSVKKLALNSYLSITNMSKVLDKLEGDGYVARSFDPTNKRVNIIQLTDKGRELIDTFDNLSYKIADEILDVYQESEKIRLLELTGELNGLLAKLQEKEG